MLLFMEGAFVYASWTYARQITRLTAAYDLKTDLNSHEPQKEKSLNAKYHSLNKSKFKILYKQNYTNINQSNNKLK